MKRRNLSLILAILMALSLMLSACGTSQEDIAGKVTPVATEPAPETTEPVPETTAAAEPETTQAPEEETTLPEENIVSIGRIEGGTYTNNYVGFAMDLDSSWTYYSAEELQDIPENVAEMFAGSELGDSLNPLEQFTDMVAENVNLLTTINVLYQKLDMQSRLIYAAMEEEAILDATLAQSDLMLEAYSQAGIEVSSMEKVTVTFLGEERPALKTVAVMQGLDYYILQVFDYHLGEYSATITFASFVEDKTEELVAMCYPIGE